MYTYSGFPKYLKHSAYRILAVFTADMTGEWRLEVVRCLKSGHKQFQRELKLGNDMINALLPLMATRTFVLVQLVWQEILFFFNVFIFCFTNLQHLFLFQTELRASQASCKRKIP